MWRPARGGKRHALATRAILTACLIIALVAPEGPQEAVLKVGERMRFLEGSMESLSGRTLMLSLTLDAFGKEIPWYGLGYVAGDRDFAVGLGEVGGGTDWGGTHLTFTEVLTGLGIPGVILMSLSMIMGMVLFVRCYRLARKHRARIDRRSMKVFAIYGGIFLFVMTVGFFNSSISQGGNHYNMAYVAGLLLFRYFVVKWSE